MKKVSAKVITISDLVQWYDKSELELSPKYQRNSVWNETAKAYLMDTIVRGLPIPPVFLRQRVDISTKTTFREVIDGQQRVRAILEYVVLESYSIKKSHNKEFGGFKFSQLPPDIQESFLEYEILAEVVSEKDDSVIYDMFARLNSNNLVLNRQEIRNSKFWGEYKVLVYAMASHYRDFFLEQKLFSDNDFSRMRDCELISSMINMVINGIVLETPRLIDKLYNEYDNDFPERDEVEKKIDKVMDIIKEIYEYLNGSRGCFGNKNYFFTLFGVIMNQMYGIPNIDMFRNKKFEEKQIKKNKGLLFERVSSFIVEFEKNTNDVDNNYGRYAEFSEFAKNHKTRTTNKAERTSRIQLLNTEIGKE